MKNKSTCPHCGAPTVEYRHSFNRGLAVGLYELFRKGGPCKAADLKLTPTQWTNFQKLRYWGLIEKCREEGEDRSNRMWSITEHGEAVCRGQRNFPQWVITYRGETRRFEGIHVGIDDYLPAEYRKAEDYAADSIPINPQDERIAKEPAQISTNDTISGEAHNGPHSVAPGSSCLQEPSPYFDKKGQSVMDLGQ